MEKIDWQDSWRVGIKKIDLQHRAFVDIYNTFVEACEEGESHDLLYPTLKNMLDYLKNHFSDEESWMIKVGYNNFGSHLKEHRQFTEQTNAFVSRYFEGDDSITDELCEFLRNWFVHHVTGTDMKYAPIFKDWLARHPDDTL